jgi:hypothetical protein
VVTVSELVEQVHREIEAGREIEATDLLVFYLDGIFRAGDFESGKVLIQTLDLDSLPLRVLGGVYMVCRHAQKELGSEYSKLLDVVSSRVPGLFKGRT